MTTTLPRSGRHGLANRDEASQSGPHAAVPATELPARVGWVAAVVEPIGRAAHDAVRHCVIDLDGANREVTRVTVTWPDDERHRRRQAVGQSGVSVEVPGVIEAQGRATT